MVKNLRGGGSVFIRDDKIEFDSLILNFIGRAMITAEMISHILPNYLYTVESCLYTVL